MTTEEFKELCDNIFTKYGFSKRRKRERIYYLQGKTGLLCGIHLQKSNYGSAYYINYDFSINEYESTTAYPNEYEFDFGSRFAVMSKVTIKGKTFMGALIEYTKYTVEELSPYLENTFDDIIVPALMIDKTNLIPHCLNEKMSPSFGKSMDSIILKLQT